MWWGQLWSVASESQALHVQLAKAVPVVQAWWVQAVVQITYLAGVCSVAVVVSGAVSVGLTLNSHRCHLMQQ